MSKGESPYDLTVLKKLVSYTRPYRGVFILVSITSILTSAFAVSRPYFLQKAIDLGILQKDSDTLLFYISIMLLVLVLEVSAQLSFIYFANWLGQHVVKDVRVNLFQRMLGFQMKYFDNSAVGRLVTRAVSDIEKIADIFSQGLFMIISDVIKMAAIVLFMPVSYTHLTLPTIYSV